MDGDFGIVRAFELGQPLGDPVAKPDLVVVDKQHDGGHGAQHLAERREVVHGFGSDGSIAVRILRVVAAQPSERLVIDHLVLANHDNLATGHCTRVDELVGKPGHFA